MFFDLQIKICINLTSTMLKKAGNKDILRIAPLLVPQDFSWFIALSLQQNCWSWEPSGAFTKVSTEELIPT